MMDLENSIELNHHHLQSMGRCLIDQKFAMRHDPIEHSERAIAFANSIRGRNHYKRNYMRNLRVRKSCFDVKKAALNFISEIKNNLNKI